MLAEYGDLTIEEALDVLRAHAAGRGIGISRLAGALVRGETTTQDVLGLRRREPR
jgi:hypothetical protein